MKPVIKDHKIKAKHAQAINVFVQWGSSYRNFLLLVMEKVNRDSGLRHNTFTYLTEAIHKFKLVVPTETSFLLRQVRGSIGCQIFCSFCGDFSLQATP